MLFFSKKDVLTPLTIEEARNAFWMPIIAIGRIPLSEDVSIDDIKVTRKDLQAAYQEVKKRELKIGFVNFFLWVSTMHVAKIADTLARRYEIPEMLASMVSIQAEDAINMLRLFHINHNYFLDALIVQNQAERRKLFVAINTLWYDAVCQQDKKKSA